MLRILRTSVSLCLLVLLIACAADSYGPDSVPLADTKWRAAFIDQKPVELGPDGEEITLEIGIDTASGFSGCNRYTSSFSQDESLIEFGTIASTRRACPGTDNLESKLFIALDGAVRYTLRNRVLTLYSAEPALLIQFETID